MAGEIQRQGQQQGLARAQPTVLDVLQSRKAEFARVIPRHLNPERLLRVAQSAIARNPKLLACTAPSLLRSVMQAATLGLEIDVLGEAYLIPYGKDAQFQPGYQGLIKLAIQSGAVMGIQAAAVRPKDVFDFQLGSEPRVVHRPHLHRAEELDGDGRLPEMVAVYAVVKLKTGEFQAVIMSKAEVDMIRARSRARGEGPWVTDYEAMAIKTAIKRALKYVPKTPELARALETDDRGEMGTKADDLFDLPQEPMPGEEPPAPPQGTADRARATLDRARTNAGKPADDVPFETAEEEKARLEREKQQPREPGAEG